MNRRLFFAGALGTLCAQQRDSPKDEFICPMDRDVRAPAPGKCSRCGMNLVAHLPDPEQFHFHLRTIPRIPQPGRTTRFEFAIGHPNSGEPVKDFEIVHTKIFHLFLLHQDLGWFAHEHPERLANGLFAWHGVLPRPGAYRIVADCYPRGATPQFLMGTVFTRDALAAPGPKPLLPDPGPKHGANLDVEFVTEPAQPIAGQETLLFFRLHPVDRLEQYLAAWGHMLIASHDLVDVIHDHPLYAYPEARDKPQIQFNVIFPRAVPHRIWVQFQRDGVVNTVNFTVPVRRLGE